MKGTELWGISFSFFFPFFLTWSDIWFPQFAWLMLGFNDSLITLACKDGKIPLTFSGNIYYRQFYMSGQNGLTDFSQEQDLAESLASFRSPLAKNHSRADLQSSWCPHMRSDWEMAGVGVTLSPTMMHIEIEALSPPDFLGNAGQRSVALSSWKENDVTSYMKIEKGAGKPAHRTFSLLARRTT